MSTDIDRLLTLFTSSSELIENNFSSLRQRIDDLEHNVIEAIRKERDQAIKDERIRAEKAINELKQEIKEMSASIIAEQKHNHECN